MADNNNIQARRLVKPGEILDMEHDILIDGTFLRGIELLDMDMTEVNALKVYLYGEYYYIYRGYWDLANANNLPGIYMDKVTGKIVRLDPITKEDKEHYTYAGKIYRTDPFSIQEIGQQGKLKIVNVPESSRAFITPLKSSDDILKRLVKLAIMDKDIALDDYKGRFVDKNALFNFKQVLKGDSRLSMLLFDRGINALNLKYTIILEEKNPEEALGKALSMPLTATSEDTYEV